MPKRKVPAGLQIKSFNPNTSSYTDRVSDEQWDNHRELLERLHNQGLPRATMLEKLQAQGFSPSIHQLNAKMTEWGFRVYRRHKTPKNPSTGDGNVITPSRTDNLDAEAQMKSLPTDPVQAHRVTNIETDSKIPENDLVSGLTSMSLLEKGTNAFDLPPDDDYGGASPSWREVPPDPIRPHELVKPSLLKPTSEGISELVYRSPEEFVDQALDLIIDADLNDNQKQRMLYLLGRLLLIYNWRAAAFRFHYAVYLIIKKSKYLALDPVYAISSLIYLAGSEADKKLISEQAESFYDILDEYRPTDELERSQASVLQEYLLRFEADPQSTVRHQAHLLEELRLEIANSRTEETSSRSVPSYLCTRHFNSLPELNKRQLHSDLQRNVRIIHRRCPFILAWCCEKLVEMADQALIEFHIDLFLSHSSALPCHVALQSNFVALWIDQYCSDLDDVKDSDKLPSEVMCHESCLICLTDCFSIMSALTLIAVADVFCCNIYEACELQARDGIISRLSELKKTFFSLRHKDSLELYNSLCDARYVIEIIKTTGQMDGEQSSTNELGPSISRLADHLVKMLRHCDPATQNCRFDPTQVTTMNFTFRTTESRSSSHSTTTASFHRLAKRMRLLASLPLSVRLAKIPFDDTSSHSSWRMSIMSSLRSRKSSLSKFVS